jgi:hypothetical protein
MNMDLTYGLKTNGKELESALDDLIDINRASASTFDIQRRGTHYPGDTNSFSVFGPAERGSTGMLPFAPWFGRDSDNSSSLFGFNTGLDSIAIQNAWGNGNTVNGGSVFSRIAKQKMALCVQAYKGFGVAKNVIDLMSNFASEGLKIQHPRKNIQKFYERWAELVDLNGRVKDILRYYYKYGNVFIYTTYGMIDDETYNTMKSAKAALRELKAKGVSDTNDPADPQRDEKIAEESQKPERDREIPWRYTLLNPFQMDLVGDKFFGQSRWVFVLDENTFKTLEYPNDDSQEFLDETEINLPPEFKNLVNSSGKGEEARIVQLNQENLWTMHYMKDDHEDWADPMLWPVMADINYKNKLRQSDISVCNSIIKAITLFKIGDYANGFIPGGEYMRKFSELLRTPTEAMTLVWNDAIEIDHSYPPVERMLSVDKYEAVDRDILRGLGIPDILLGGAGANYATGFLGVRTLLERLEEGRREVEKWVNKQLRMIAQIMGHRDIPRIRFGRMSLRDETAEKQLILGLLDRNVISIEAVLEVFGEDFDIELSRLRREEEIRNSEDIFVKHGPFVDPLSDMNASDNVQTENDQMDTQHQNDMQKIDKQMKQQQQFKKMDVQVKKQDLIAKRKMLKQGSKTKKVNGRPTNTKGISQTKKRDTKPKGMAFIEYERDKAAAGALYNSVEEIITDCILESTGKKYKKALAQTDRNGIEELSFAVASYMDLDEPVTLDSVKKIMSFDTLVVEPITAAAEEFIGSHYENPTAEQRRDIRAQAIAMSFQSEEEDGSE